MKLAYDFHIHTGASPCANEDMTPNNIVNMAILKELDAIAITDHNTCANVKAVMDVAQDTPLIVLPGMEVETSEEIHAIVLFEGLAQIMELEKIIHRHLPKISNRKDIFGSQIIYDAYDEVIGEIDQMLITATSLSIYELVAIVGGMGGVCYPAHIDRTSYSIISNLGLVPTDLGIQHIEISKNANLSNFTRTYPHLNVIQSSDAHYLGDLLERQSYIQVKTNLQKEWIETLRHYPK